MKIRIEAGDGRPDRFKLVDADTGRKLGLVQSVELNVNNDASVMRFEVMLCGRSEFNGDEYWTVVATDMRTQLSPWLRGTMNDKQEYVFEDIDAPSVPFEMWLDLVRNETVSK